MTATLLLAALRRDRVRLASWTLGLALFWLYYTRLVPTAYPEEDLQAASGLVAGPMGRVFVGPSHGFDDLSYDRFLAGGYGIYAMLLTAVMSILLVVRNTRADEQAGRTELVLAGAVHRRAPLVSALGVALVANLAVGLAIFVVSATSPLMAWHGSALFAASVVAAGVTFAAVAAVTAQLTEFPRAAGGLAGVVLGASFLVRALGDAPRQGGTLLSWFSPLAWPQQTAPFVLDRWWPLLLSVALVAVLAATALVVSSRRDVGTGIVTSRPGPPEAPAWLGSPATLSLRLQRASIVGWTVTLLVFGAVFGAWSDVLGSAVEDLPDTLIDVMRAGDDLVAGYLAFMGLFMGLIVGIYAMLAMHQLRAEEASGRAGPVLASPVGRATWLLTHVGVTAAAVVAMLILTGVGTGIGAALVTGRWGYVADLVVGYVSFAPAVLVVLGLASALFGFVPRAIGAAWAVLAYGLLVDVFGPLVELPTWVVNASPFAHVALVPVEEVAPIPLVVTAVVALALLAVGLVGVRRRDLDLP